MEDHGSQSGSNAAPSSAPGSAPIPALRSASPKLFPGVFLRGMLMGAADVVPGVSGGTIAFITGIYQRLITAFSSVDLDAVSLVLKGQWLAAWHKVDANFLLVLFAGVGLSILTLARGVSYLLENQPLLLWAFFFGLIFASSLVLLRQVKAWSLTRMLALGCAAAFALALAFTTTAALPQTNLVFFLAGFFAICAMILPGISGSFILVLLGMYEPVITAIKEFLWFPLISFTVGNALGLLSFSRLLRWLLERHQQLTLASLTGFLLGSLLIVWPWKIEQASEAAGSSRSVPVTPIRYAQEVADSQLLACAALALLGFFLVWLIETRWGDSGP
ncbi:MAG: DUF368 domain-containing protein [Pseudomonadota bacterium]